MSRRSRVERALFPLILRQPRLGLALADLLRRIQYRVHPGRDQRNLTSRGDWEKLLGPQSRDWLHEVRCEQFRNVQRSFLVEKYLKRAPLADARKLVRWEHFERIRAPLDEGRPLIVALWHVGPLFASALGLRVLDRPVSVILHRKVTGEIPEGWELIYTERGRAAGIQAFRKGVARLKEGRPLAIACDVFCRDGDRLPARVFGLDLELRRGFAAIARVSGAIIVPVTIRWSGTSTLVYEALPPLKSSDGDRSDREAFELAVISEYARTVDAYMRLRPYDLDPRRVGLFIQAWKRIHKEQYNPTRHQEDDEP